MSSPSSAPLQQPASPHIALQEHPRGADSYQWFIVGVATWFTAIGMQNVLFSWLVVSELHAKAEWVGIAQSATMLPSVLLILVGGAIADRHDRRSLLIGLHLLAAFLSAGLVFLVASAKLTLPLLLVYAVAAGSVQAFVMPARDALLSEVAGPNLMRAVTSLTLVQWGTQAVGALAAGSARWVGTVPALCVHCLIVLSGVLPLRKLSPMPTVHGAVRRQLRLSEIVEGVREVLHSPVLLPVFLLVTAVGILFIGPFMVVFPILVRDYYGGDIGQLALLNMMFPVGTILGSAGLLWYGQIRRKGAAQLGALVFGSCCLGVIAVGLPFWGTLAAGGAWGLGAAVFTNTGRTMFQEQAPPSHRARVLSVYMFGFMGASGLIGAPLSGVLVARIGPLATCAVASGVMLTVLACTFLFTNVSRME
ncbi:MAG: MFS transporter [Deltaproteobacteria bacterium]|nr:MFS transporter [Deltaproteobacteria bacterium]